MMKAVEPRYENSCTYSSMCERYNLVSGILAASKTNRMTNGETRKRTRKQIAFKETVTTFEIA
jgi:hypothetical protein